MRAMAARAAGPLTAVLDAKRDVLWDALEWLAIPVFILYPQLAVLKWYRYGS
jgi:hypothetical protein